MIEDAIPASIPRVALVTGAARRIGRAIAVALAGAGFDVAVHCHSSHQAAEQTRAEIESLGRRAAILRADLRDEASTAQLLSQAQAALGDIGVLVNSAAVFERDEWDTVTRARWDAHMGPNLRAPFVLMQE